MAIRSATRVKAMAMCAMNWPRIWLIREEGEPGSDEDRKARIRESRIRNRTSWTAKDATES
jgi:hypothetical protein